MKIWHTALALIVLLALGGALYYVRQNPQVMPQEGFPKEDLFTFDPSQVDGLTIEIDKESPMVFQKSVDGSQTKWAITSPPGIAGDSKSIENFIGNLPKIKAIPLNLEPGTSLSDYGFEQPQRKYSFQITGGQPFDLEVGGENPNGFARYGRLAGSEKIFMLDLLNAEPLIRNVLFDYRDKRAVPLDMSQVQQIELQYYLRGGAPSAQDLEEARRRRLPVNPPKVVFSRQSSGDWKLTSPSVRTDYGTAQELIRALENSQILAYEDENPQSLNRYGLAPEEVRAELRSAAGTSNFIIGNLKEGEELRYYARNSIWPYVFTVDQSIYSQLTKDMEQYRSRYLFDYSAAPATRRLEIQTADGSLRLDRKGDTWASSDSSQKAIDTAKVDAFLNYIYSLRIQHYVEDRPNRYDSFGLEAPWIVIKVYTGDSNTEETVLFGRKGEGFYTARQGEPSIYEMAPGEPENIETRLKELGL
ncbi:MAG: hypothetical protein A3F68_12805 [Acidobacteria bacterium RIFCSPLOWO2_12_FULL_54_10]|nr:MAG: hypothetical protein A3F68_12805 [Acidobacteria bacterium RIFCSPLOWO2_12_FULL_54_10]